MRPNPLAHDLRDVPIRVFEVDTTSCFRPVDRRKDRDVLRPKLFLPLEDVVLLLHRKSEVRLELRRRIVIGETMSRYGTVRLASASYGGRRGRSGLVFLRQAASEEEKGSLAEGEDGHAVRIEDGRAETEGVAIEGDRAREVFAVCESREKRRGVSSCALFAGRAQGGGKRVKITTRGRGRTQGTVKGAQEGEKRRKISVHRQSSRTCEILGSWEDWRTVSVSYSRDWKQAKGVERTILALEGLTREEKEEKVSSFAPEAHLSPL